MFNYIPDELENVIEQAINTLTYQLYCDDVITYEDYQHIITHYKVLVKKRNEYSVFWRKIFKDPEKYYLTTAYLPTNSFPEDEDEDDDKVEDKKEKKKKFKLITLPKPKPEKN